MSQCNSQPRRCTFVIKIVKPAIHMIGTYKMLRKLSLSWMPKIVRLEFYHYVLLASNPLTVIIGNKCSKNTKRLLCEEIANARAPPRSNPFPTLEEDANDDQALVNPPLWKDRNITAALLKMGAIQCYSSTSSNYSSSIHDIPRLSRGCTPR